MPDMQNESGEGKSQEYLSGQTRLIWTNACHPAIASNPEGVKS
jgi:hypothetical protein